MITMCERETRTGKLQLFVLCMFVVVYYRGGDVTAAASSTSANDENQHYSWRDNSTEMLLNRCRRDCAIYRNVMSCGKFKALQWIDNVVKEKEYVYGPLKIIKIPAGGERFLPPVPRAKKSSLMYDTMYFLRESAEELLTRRALVYTVDQPQGARSLNAASGIMVLDEEELGEMQRARTFDVSVTAGGKNRLFKKKKSIILPVLILLNLLKIKLLILPIFLGVHFIKKLLVLGSLILPSVLSHLKVCKIAQQPYHHHYWGNSAEYPPVDYPAYGPEDAWDHRNDVAAPQGAYGGGSHYPHNFYNPFYYYFQNYNKQRR